jgi:two-component system, LytTR family, response regulator LytT
MNVVIIEDEILASERLQILLKKYDASINVVASLETVEEAIHYLQTSKHADILFVDIHLADGHSFEIFKKVKTTTPIIFTTAYDQYALDAFQLFSIDYILKPVTAESLANAFAKYHGLTKANNIPVDYALLIQQMQDSIAGKYKSRFLAKVGQRTYFIPVNEVAYFVADNKIVHLVARDGKRYIKNATIEKLEEIIDPSVFFRVNRKVIVHIDAIEQTKPYDNNRLVIVIRNINTAEEIIVSREKVQDFKTWANT